MSSTRRIDAPARYNSTNASSTDDSLRRYRIEDARLERQLSQPGSFNFTSPAFV
jgi:hypothetical protein